MDDEDDEEDEHNERRREKTEGEDHAEDSFVKKDYAIAKERRDGTAAVPPSV